MARGLAPEEAALWARVMASVRPLRPVPVASPPPLVRSEQAEARPKAPRKATIAPPVPLRPAPRPTHAEATLDGGWDRKVARGTVIPDSSIDLHGHTLRSAHALLDFGIDRAIARGDRVLLLVTGKPPRPESERPHARGAIRAAVADWLAASRHANDIAAIRNAHPRHGGQGALYLVLRRRRGG